MYYINTIRNGLDSFLYLVELWTVLAESANCFWTDLAESTNLNICHRTSDPSAVLVLSYSVVGSAGVCPCVVVGRTGDGDNNKLEATPPCGDVVIVILGVVSDDQPILADGDDRRRDRVNFTNKLKDNFATIFYVGFFHPNIRGI